MITHDLDLPALGTWACDRVAGSLFWTVSGSHLYGFSSADSDIDLRGAFAAPLPALVGIRNVVDTREAKDVLGGREVESVAHEAGKYLRLLAKHNGYVLEQIFSPLVARGADFLERLRPIARKCVTTGCHRHYRGFLHTTRAQFEKETAKKAKTLLYAYRVVLTGIHMLETGEVEPHLPTLNERFRVPFIPELIARKASAEFGVLTDVDVAFHREQLAEWEKKLDAAHAASKLPAEPPWDELDRFLVELRLG